MRLSSETKNRLRGIRDVWGVFLCFFAACVALYGLFLLADYLWGPWGAIAVGGALLAAIITGIGYHAGRSA